jgi:hypothetical protein
VVNPPHPSKLPLVKERVGRLKRAGVLRLKNLKNTEAKAANFYGILIWMVIPAEPELTL